MWFRKNEEPEPSKDQVETTIRADYLLMLNPLATHAQWLLVGITRGTSNKEEVLAHLDHFLMDIKNYQKNAPEQTRARVASLHSTIKRAKELLSNRNYDQQVYEIAIERVHQEIVDEIITPL